MTMTSNNPDHWTVEDLRKALSKALNDKRTFIVSADGKFRPVRRVSLVEDHSTKEKIVVIYG